MNVVEQALVFVCGDAHLVGVVSKPEAQRDTAVIVIVGGPQYRAGSHRQFTLQARRLAAEGWPVLRFDYRGMGDSTGAQRDFEAVSDDIQAAIDASFAALPGLRRVVLWGLCDGASAALLHLRDRSDPRVAGLCLLNPWVRSPASLARTHVKHYYLNRLREREFWAKLVRGGVALKALQGLMHNLRRMGLGRAVADAAAGTDFRLTMARAWSAYDGAILLILSGNDYTAREFLDVARTDPDWRDVLARISTQRCDFAAADHTFSVSAQRSAMEAAVATWLAQQFGVPARGLPMPEVKRT